MGLCPSLASSHQFSQIRNRSSPFDEFVVQQFLCGWTTICLFVEASSHKIFKFAAIFAALQAWRRRFRNEEEDFHRMRGSVRRLSMYELHCGDTERPDVGLEVIPGLLDDLRRHPERGADKGVPL